jgi:hypothetical protein
VFLPSGGFSSVSAVVLALAAFISKKFAKVVAVGTALVFRSSIILVLFFVVVLDPSGSTSDLASRLMVRSVRLLVSVDAVIIIIAEAVVSSTGALADRVAIAALGV